MTTTPPRRWLPKVLSNAEPSYEFHDNDEVTRVETVSTKTLARNIEQLMLDCETALNGVVIAQTQLAQAESLYERRIQLLRAELDTLNALVFERVPQCRICKT